MPPSHKRRLCGALTSKFRSVSMPASSRIKLDGNIYLTARQQDEYYLRHRKHTKYRCTGTQLQKKDRYSDINAVATTMANAEWGCFRPFSTRKKSNRTTSNYTKANNYIPQPSTYGTTGTAIFTYHRDEVMTHLQRPTWVTLNWLTINTSWSRNSKNESNQGKA